MFFSKAVVSDSFLDFDVTETDAIAGKARHFTRKAAPHILHLRLASVHMLHRLRLREEEEPSMVVVSLWRFWLFTPMCVRHPTPNQGI